MKIECPACGEELISNEKLGEAIKLGVTRNELLDLAAFIKRRSYLEEQTKKVNKRLQKLIEKLGDEGWNVPKMIVKEME